MVNRIAPRAAAAAQGPPPYGDFYVLTGDFGFVGFITVAPEVAREIERVLERRWRPRWLVFRDRVGSRVRVRTAAVRSLVQSTAAQRARERELARAQQLEAAADRLPWEDDG